MTGPVLPDWAIVGEKRRAHIARVTGLLDRWAATMRLDADEAQAWHDAGRWHDAFRDGTPEVLRPLVGDPDMLDGLLHGPAAAVRLERDGETRRDVLEAVRWHTVGYPRWARTGRALFMADVLEPGRRFMSTDRAFLAAQVPVNFDGVFRQVVRMRLEWTLREGNRIHTETAELWNSVR